MGRLKENDCCSFPPDPRIKILANCLSEKFKKEMGNLTFNGGQLLNYAADILALNHGIRMGLLMQVE